MTSGRAAGFSLVELMIGLAIAAILVILAMPSYSVWIADAQIRNAAESIADGLRYAQSQAIARNARILFTINPTTGTGGWTAQQFDNTACKPVGAPIRAGTFQEGASMAAFTSVPSGAKSIHFTSLGLIDLAPCDGSTKLDQIQITSSTGVAGARNLNVLIGDASVNAGQARIKICDPKWPATDPKGCPP